MRVTVQWRATGDADADNLAAHIVAIQRRPAGPGGTRRARQPRLRLVRFNELGGQLILIYINMLLAQALQIKHTYTLSFPVVLPQVGPPSDTGSRLEAVNHGVLECCSVDKSFSDYAIPLPDSVDRTRAELRRAGYPTNPAERVAYLRGMGGDYLHHDLVKFDVLAKENVATVKGGLSCETLFLVPREPGVERAARACEMLA